MMARVANEKAQARAQVQRERILEAAYSCFKETGFHAAGMAAISERADMSPGLIYRYFPNGKSEIIQAIIEAQLELTEAEIGLMQPVDLPTELLAHLDRPDAERKGMDPSLMLELSAIASRDPEIAAVVKRFDVRIREALAQSIARSAVAAGTELPMADASARAMMVQLVFEGMVVRQAREADVDRAVLRHAVEQLFVGLGPPEARTA